MRELLRLLNAPCRDIAALVSASMDTELSGAQRWAVRIHLLYCRACRAYRRHVRMLRQIVQAALRQSDAAIAEAETGRPALPTPAPTLSDEARERIKNTLENR